MGLSLERPLVPKRIDNFEGVDVTYIETTYPNEFVECDVYKFVDDRSRDLAIVRVQANAKTPIQRVLLGEETIERFMSGNGRFVVNDMEYKFPNDSTDLIVVRKGDIMQWHAGDEGLTFYEICTPPYADGRFEEIKS